MAGRLVSLQTKFLVGTLFRRRVGAGGRRPLLAQLPQFAGVEDGKSGTYGKGRHYTGAV